MKEIVLIAGTQFKEAAEAAAWFRQQGATVYELSSADAAEGADVLAAIGEQGGPRCCKRDAYLAIQAAAEFTREHLGVKMETGEIRCTRCRMNNQCQGKACPFHPASK